MNTDGDLECTCDVGVFAELCDVCRASELATALARSEDRRRREKQERPKREPVHVVDLVLHYQNLARKQ